MKFLRELYGDGAVELVAAYLRMAEANVGLARYQQAEQFLSMANWVHPQEPRCLERAAVETASELREGLRRAREVG